MSVLTVRRNLLEGVRKYCSSLLRSRFTPKGSRPSLPFIQQVLGSRSREGLSLSGVRRLPLSLSCAPSPVLMPGKQAGRRRGFRLQRAPGRLVE